MLVRLVLDLRGFAAIRLRSIMRTPRWQDLPRARANRQYAAGWRLITNHNRGGR
ncbi:hypothetical protein CTP10_R07580 [Cupriavidus sp. P-10]|uniref:hypothetical protein n=1 Tax=Cupriavidus sp. P-10 TaxID=2027911 RepID=UPI001314F223|nr:hypothetical protein [Cupriavidus sp. P-10]BDB23427.1 hypothetical protein CTP10_R07580 [Cupriavidus sp. P-10]